MITGVVLARNEQHNIVPCLEALKKHVQELLLIDMESQDDTVALAEPLVDKVIPHRLITNFDAARNVAADHASHEWLWFVDADERVPEQTGRMVRKLIQQSGSEFDAINIPFKSYFCGKWMEHCGWWPGYTMPRVLKKGKFKFPGKLHSGVEVDGREIRLSPDPALGVDHFSYLSIEHYLEKLNRYTSTEAEQLLESGHDNSSWDWRNGIRHMVHDLWMYYEPNQGHLDREHGWILSWLSGQYRWLTWAKLLDLRDGEGFEQATVPSNLDELLQFMEREVSALRARTPQVPLGVTWRTPIWDPSGYAEEGRLFVKAMAEGARQCTLEDIHWSDSECQLPSRDAGLFRALLNGRRAPFVATITNCIPTLVEPDPCASLNILRTTFETDRIPMAWLPQIDKFDEVWVISEHNVEAFRRSGVPPEKIRHVPSGIDTDVYHTEGDKFPLPAEMAGRFTYLSIFDWQWRKGWDVLLRAYAAEFGPDDGVGLLLKISRAHGHTMKIVRKQASRVLEELEQSLEGRPDILIWEEMLQTPEMAGLYRSADAYVMASRGEGWGRPYMEAMACGLPVIGTGASGNMDFMNEENSLLIAAELVDAPERAAHEIRPYEGHRWYEPDVQALRDAMRRVREDEALRRELGTKAFRQIHGSFGPLQVRANLQAALAEAEKRFVYPTPPAATDEQIHVQLEGELFACHSFANVNEKLAAEFNQRQEIALQLRRVHYNPSYDDQSLHAHRLLPLVDRDLPDGPQVIIRHSFLPNWNPVQGSQWVHIQPWEFGHLPKEWIGPLRDQVDEVWCPSMYVKRVYERSGIDSAKIQLIPWGVDPEIYTPEAPSLLLPTNKSFKFLFVGGTIHRKGFDTLLDAYLSEFGPEDDVCLVVKDMGTQTFYRYGNLKDRVLQARDDASLPDIVYFDHQMSEGQIVSLYTACDCLAIPYRGEGFGLPILEAMACGIPPIIPQGGASDDFVSPDTAYLLPSQEVPGEHDWELTGPPLELKVDVADVRQAMRAAYENQQETQEKGRLATAKVRQQFTWQRTVEMMVERIQHLAEPRAVTNGIVAACLAINNDEQILPDCLARVAPMVDELIVVDGSSSDRSREIAAEYGARFVDCKSDDPEELRQLVSQVKSRWYFWIEPGMLMDDAGVERIVQQLRSQSDDAEELSFRIDVAHEDGRIRAPIRFYRSAASQ